MAAEPVRATRVIGPAERLAECEARIESGFRSAWLVTGQALGEIRESRLYKLAGCATFAGYVTRKWDLGLSQANNLITAAAIAGALTRGNTKALVSGENGQKIGEKTPLPARESHARALAAAPEPLRVAVWEQVWAATRGRPTAKAVAEAASAAAGVQPGRHEPGKSSRRQPRKRPGQETGQPGGSEPPGKDGRPPVGPARAADGAGTPDGGRERESPQEAAGEPSQPAPADGQGTPDGAAAEITEIGDSISRAELDALRDRAALADELAAVLAGLSGGWGECWSCKEARGLPVHAVRGTSSVDDHVCAGCLPRTRARLPDVAITIRVPVPQEPAEPAAGVDGT